MYDEPQPLNLLPAENWYLLWAAAEPQPEIGCLRVAAFATVAGQSALEPMVMYEGCNPTFFRNVEPGMYPNVTSRLLYSNSTMMFNDAYITEVFEFEILAMCRGSLWTTEQIEDVLAHAGIRS